MKEIGRVERVDKNYIWVRVIRKSACGENCASCKGGCVPTERTVCVKNTMDCQSGDKVILEMSSHKVIGAAFLVYIIPLIALFLGYFLGEYIFKNEGSAVITGVIAMAVSLALIKIFDKKSTGKFMAEITGILNKNANDS